MTIGEVSCCRDNWAVSRLAAAMRTLDLERAIVKVHQHSAGFDHVAFLEVHFEHLPGMLRAQWIALSFPPYPKHSGFRMKQSPPD